MKLCTTSIINGLDNKPHFAVVLVGQSGWPMLLGGPSEGANSKQNKAEIEFFAKAPVMHDMLEHLSKEFADVQAEKPLSAEQLSALSVLVERATRLIAA